MTEQDEKNMRRVAFFVLLSLFLHALLGGFFYRLQEKLRASLKRYFRKSMGRRPMILPVIWEM